jgi:hypothetical protein
MSQCSVCTRPISGMDVLYTREGELICPQCHALRDLHEADVRAAKNIPKAARWRRPIIASVSTSHRRRSSSLSAPCWGSPSPALA